MVNGVFLNAVVALVFLLGVLLFVVGIVVVAFGAFWWAEAVRAAHTARAHGTQADETAVATAQANEAFTALTERYAKLDNPATRAYEPPSDDELRKTVLAGRNGKVKFPHEEPTTTEYNEGFEEEPPIMPGGFYRQ